MDPRLFPAPISSALQQACASPALCGAFSSLAARPDFDLADTSCQEECAKVLAGSPGWDEFVGAARSALEARPLRPVLVGPGLGICEDGVVAQCKLIALARGLFPQGVCPPYEVGNLAVTEVTAQEGSSAASHSMNDLPAPPHTAGFFEPVPPQFNLFACVAPHQGGGGATVVADMVPVLAGLSAEELRTVLSSTVYQYRTPARLGRTCHPLTMLSFAEGLPFLRYRDEYTTVPAEGAEAFQRLTALLSDPAHEIAHVLQPDEILVLFNGCPHGRRALAGDAGAIQRKLLRCRVVPQGDAWPALFSGSTPAEVKRESSASMRQRWEKCSSDALLAKQRLRRETIAMQEGLGESAIQAHEELEVLEALLTERGVAAVPEEGLLKNTQHGSYVGYYGVRPLEPRMAILREETRWFSGARVLDIGCNSGEFSAAVAEELGVSSLLGVDIDADLVATATSRFGSSRMQFAQADWGDPARPRADDGVFDVVLCFSVTKWIQLNHGDTGVLHLFRRVHESLARGGVFILEPQPVKSYRKVHCLSEAMKRNFEEMQLWPELFAAFLTSGVFRPGFVLLGRHCSKDTSQRDVFVFQKVNS